MGECPFLLDKQDPKGKCSDYLEYRCYLNENRGLFGFLNNKEEKKVMTSESSRVSSSGIKKTVIDSERDVIAK